MYRNNKLLHGVQIYLKEAVVEKQLSCWAGEPLPTAQYRLDNPELINVTHTNNRRSAMMPEKIALLTTKGYKGISLTREIYQGTDNLCS